MKNIVVSILAGAALVVASCTSTAVVDKTQHTGRQLRVMAYNVHHCNPPSKPNLIDIDAIAGVIRTQNPDLVALQEIDVHTSRSGNINQAEELAKKLNMHFFFGKAIDYGGGKYGVAILSKYPLTDTVVYQLPTQANTNGEPRVLASAKVALPGGQVIRFGSTHLDVQKDPTSRLMQVQRIGEISALEQVPFILAGDLNDTADSAPIRELDKHLTRTCQRCAPTIPVINPTKAIDYVAFSPATAFKIVSHEVVPERYASDHLPIVAVLRY